MPVNLKTASPDTSIPTGAFLIGADSQSAANPSVYAVDSVVAPRVGELVMNAPLVLPATTGTGMRMMSPATSNVTGGTCTINRLYFSPIHFYKNRTLTTFAIYCTTLGASSAVRLGLYEDAGGVPGAFVADFGTVDTTSTGFKEISISQAVVSTKWYWGALVAGNANPGLASATTGCLASIGAATGTAPGGNHQITTMFHSFTYGTLPTTDRSGESYTRVSNSAFIFYWS